MEFIHCIFCLTFISIFLLLSEKNSSLFYWIGKTEANFCKKEKNCNFYSCLVLKQVPFTSVLIFVLCLFLCLFYVLIFVLRSYVCFLFLCLFYVLMLVLCSYLCFMFLCLFSVLIFVLFLSFFSFNLNVEFFWIIFALHT